ncbi:GNAT family N-acetyltransferase [Corynebacterium sp. H127]|uniref:GNAT family N-acetyltransferase n=1 Tax=Corynebacterium sp. H127 TaxID=3133418 RepID=UPI00309B0F02
MELRAATWQDLEQLAEVFGRAFHGTPQWEWIIPNATARERILPAFFRPMFGHVLKHGRLTVAIVDGSIVGGAAWLPSSKLDVPRWRGLRSFPTIIRSLRGAELKQFGERGPAMDSAARAAHPKMPHEYLAALAVLPEAQGAGVGAALLQRGLFAPVTYVQCEEALVPYYQRFGFRGCLRIAPGNGAPVQIGMLRD